MAYFYYTKTVFGKLSPRKSSDAPIYRSAEGEKRVIVNVIELSPAESQLDLFTLAKIYPNPWEIEQTPYSIAAE